VRALAGPSDLPKRQDVTPMLFVKAIARRLHLDTSNSANIRLRAAMAAAKPDTLVTKPKPGR
jgi:hypothetical protein